MILLDPSAQLVIAHRGGRAHAPENTLAAFERAVALKPDGMEFDVRLSADGVAMVIHDATVDRTTSGTGLVSSLTCAQLQRLDAGCHFTSPTGESPFRERGVTIPTLESVLATADDLPLIIEVKELSAVAETRRLLAKFGAAGRVIVGSVRADVMALFYGGPYATCASLRDAASLLPALVTRRRGPRPPFDVLSITPWYSGMPIPVVALSRAAARMGIPTHVWTVNRVQQAESYWHAGIAGILSDDPALIMRARAATVCRPDRSA